MRKERNKPLSFAYLQERVNNLKKHGFEKTKWIEFSELLLSKGYQITLYEARKTSSKYLTIKKKGFKNFRVRFSNHPPIKAREKNNDCDFFVGRTNFKITTTEMAVEAVKNHFKEQ